MTIELILRVGVQLGFCLIIFFLPSPLVYHLPTYQCVSCCISIIYNYAFNLCSNRTNNTRRTLDKQFWAFPVTLYYTTSTGGNKLEKVCWNIWKKKKGYSVPQFFWVFPQFEHWLFCILHGSMKKKNVKICPYDGSGELLFETNQTTTNVWLESKNCFKFESDDTFLFWLEFSSEQFQVLVSVVYDYI